VTLERLKTVLDAYGGAPARWPADERAGLLALIRREPAARAMLDEAGSLDALLAEAPGAPPPDAALMARLMGAAQNTPAPVLRPLLDWSWLWPRMTGLAAAAVLGFVVGVIDLSPVSSDQQTDISGLVFGPDDSLEDMTL